MTVLQAIDRYARQIVANEIPAGKYHRLACQRHLNDRKREGTPGFQWVLHQSSVERIVKFFTQLKHYKGEWAGQSITLEAWQQFIEGSIVGWIDPLTGLRRFRHVYIEVPRKNGKTLLGGGNALYFTFLDGEPGAEGYCIATKRDQAKIAFNDSKKLVQSSGLKTRIKVRVGNLHREESASKLEPLGADHDSTDGLNVQFGLVDEFHAHKTRGLVDVIETAMASRRQPVMVKITTAGDDPVSPCGDEHEYACKILDGVIDDETYFAFIAHADEGDDWQDQRTWAKANPNYGVSVKTEDMQALATKAKNMPAAAATFKQKRLNMWVNATAPCLSIDGWRKGQSKQSVPALLIPTLQHEPCYIGIDLASKIDLCAMVLVFPPTSGRAKWRWIPCIWTPAETLQDRAHRDRAPYGVWVEQGWLNTTPGSRIDHRVIRETIAEVRGYYDIEKIGLDPWHADKISTELIQEDGFTEEQVLEIPQTFAGLSSACLRVQADILAGEVDAGGCPVTAWAVSNAVPNIDGKDNLMFAKGKSRGRIDPLIAGTIGTALSIRFPQVPDNVYLSRGVKSLADYL